MDTPPASPFQRDRFTWLAYLMLAYFAYQQAALGPLMPFLRDELKLNYTITGLHLSAFALGMTLAGATGDALVRRWGRRRVFWGGGAGMAAGALAFVLGHHPALTIAAALLMGAPGTLLMITVQATLSDRHGTRRAVALTEANIAASLSAGLAPLCVGTLQRAEVGWRGALLLGACGWATLTWRGWRVPIPPRNVSAAAGSSSGRVARLPGLFWAYWLVVFLSVSAEWSTIFWGADFLETSVGLRKVDAATLMSVFFGAILLGRILGSRLARRIPLSTLLPGAALLAWGGFLPFWLAPLAPLNVAGLFVAGLGIANLFPLTLAAASGSVAPHQVDAASSRITLAAGLAILITPQVLGTLADHTGIKSAYAVVGGFLGVAIVAILVANRFAQRSASGQNQP
ncbi:MAG: MFS transporter [Aggregatilineaceae bacterium]